MEVKRRFRGLKAPEEEIIDHTSKCRQLAKYEYIFQSSFRRGSAQYPPRLLIGLKEVSRADPRREYKHYASFSDVEGLKEVLRVVVKGVVYYLIRRYRISRIEVEKMLIPVFRSAVTSGIKKGFEDLRRKWNLKGLIEA